MTDPKTYRKKPVKIEAMQWDGTAKGATAVINWVLSEGGNASYHCDTFGWCTGTDEDHHLIIRTLEGDMRATYGDYIIRGVAGEFYPCRSDIFAQTYQEVTND